MNFFLFIYTPLLFSKETKPQQESKLEPFFTNGCSLPNALYDVKYNSCCLAHDYAYWIGGTLEDKNKSDINLVNCITKIGGWKITGLVWREALAQFGTSHWGAGWSPPRKNLPLTPAEHLKINKFRLALKNQFPQVNKSSEKIEYQLEVINTLKNITQLSNISNPSQLTCYELENEEEGISATLIFTTECKDGYFVHQKTDAIKSIKKNLTLVTDSLFPTQIDTSLDFHNLAAYGDCVKTFKPNKTTSAEPVIKYKEILIKAPIAAPDGVRK